MNVFQWAEGLRSYYFSDMNRTGVRLFDADGLAFLEVYNRNRGENPPLYDRKEAYRDFLLAVIRDVFHDDVLFPGWRTGPMRFTGCQRTLLLNRRVFRNGGPREVDCRVLPVCMFFASLWTFEFLDGTIVGNDGDYRTNRFPSAMERALEGIEGPEGRLVYDPGTLTDGILEWFRLLWEGFGPRLYMPPNDFQYRGSIADGVTISHSVFRYGEVADIYNAFSQYGFEPHRVYASEAFRKVSYDFTDEWLRSRDVSREILAECIGRLYDAWDGNTCEKYRGFIRGEQYRTESRSVSSCRLFWALECLEGNGETDYAPVIFMDCLSAGQPSFHVRAGATDVRLRSATVQDRSTYAWKLEGDPERHQNGWKVFADSRDPVVAVQDDGAEMSRILPYDQVFGGYSVYLMQSWISSAGGNRVWRLMVGSQGAELWGGDGRQPESAYALLVPSPLEEGDVLLHGDPVQPVREGSFRVREQSFFVYRLPEDANGELIVFGNRLFDFGLPHTPWCAADYLVGCKLEIRTTRDWRFFGANHSVLFYHETDDTLGLYYRPETMSAAAPCLYKISLDDVMNYETEPLPEKRVRLRYCESRGLWMVDDPDFEMDTSPWAFGLWERTASRAGQVIFQLFSPEGPVVPYQDHWKGYFLPPLEEHCYDRIFGAMLARGFRTVLHEILRSNHPYEDVRETAVADSIDAIGRLLAPPDEAEEKLDFIWNVAQPLTTRIRSKLRDSFEAFPEEFRRFMDLMPENGRMGFLENYFVLALVYLSLVSGRIIPTIGNPIVAGHYRNLLAELNDFVPNPTRFPDVHYHATFVCEAIVHVLFDGLDDEEAGRRLSQCVALADALVSRFR